MKKQIDSFDEVYDYLHTAKQIDDHLDRPDFLMVKDRKEFNECYIDEKDR